MKYISWSFLLAILALMTVTLMAIADPPGITQVYTVHVEVQGQGTVEVTPAPGTGSDSFPPTATVFYYDFNSQGIDLQWTASPESGWSFDYWELGSTGATSQSTDNPVTLSLIPGTANPSDWTVRAVFTQVTSYTISVSANPAAGGAVTGSGTYVQGTSVTVTAVANASYTFANWTKDGTIVSTDLSYTFTATEDRTLVANFTGGPGSTYTIAASANPAMGGQVIGGGTYAYGVSAVVTAQANPGYTFINWTENGTIFSASLSYTFPVTANRTLLANFTGGSAPTYTIAVSANPVTGGTVTGGGTYTQSALVTVTASANAGYTFVNWTEGGVEISTNVSYAFPATANRTLVANFAPPPPVPPPPADSLDDDVEAGPGNWTAESLWHITERDSHSPTHSWWFGDERTGTYGSGEYGTQGVLARRHADAAPKAAGGRIQGALTSEAISVNGWGQTATLSFWHWRHVEDFTDAPYDRTYVQVTFGGAVWQTVWEQNSQDPSQEDWEQVSFAVPIQDGATQMRVRFVFDSVDGVENDYPGWFIDDIRLGPPGDPDVITVIAPLVDGTVGQPYGPVQLGASGGVPPYTWSWRPSVPGLSLDQRTGTISGTPTTVGTFDVTITVMDSAGGSATLSARIVIEPDGGCACSLFFEDFTDATGWTMSGLWGVESELGCITYASMVDKYAYFGRSGTCSYATGARVMGELRSPTIDIPDCVETVVIECDQFRHVENYSAGAYDKTWLEASFDGTTWEPLWYRDSASVSPQGSHVQVGKTVPSGVSQMWIRFRFNSVDRFYNDFPGWAIDNVEVLNADCVTGAQPTAVSMVVVPKAAPRDQISVTNSPNPITDVHTTVFTVRGVNVEAMKIQIFDLSGALVYEEEVAGNELVWHTDSNHGEYLANGVYLYRALIKVGGSWITTSTQKLVILR